MSDDIDDIEKMGDKWGINGPSAIFRQEPPPSGPKHTRHMRLSFLLIFLLFFSGLAWGEETKVKRLPDGSGPFAQEMVKRHSNTGNDIKKKANSQPFVVAFFGWKAFRLAQVGVDRYTAALLKISALVIEFYDPAAAEVQTALKSLQAKGTGDTLVKSTPAELDALRKFVVMDYTKRYVMDLDDPAKKIDPELKWRYNLGSTLGELAGKLCQWHLIMERATLDSSVAESLTSLNDLIKEAPTGTDATLLAKLKALAALGAKKKYSLDDRQSVADALAQTLTAALVFSEGPAFKP